MARTRKGRARRGTGTIVQRGDRFMAQVDFGVGAGGRRDRRTRTFDTRTDAQDWLLDARQRQEELTAGVADQKLGDYLRWWIEEEAPKGKPGRAPLADTTVRGYRPTIENHIIPGLGHKLVGDLKVADLDHFANARTPSTTLPESRSRTARSTSRS